MAEMTVSWVAPDVSENTNTHGTSYYVNCAFADGTAGSLGKKKKEKALELRELLVGLMNKPAEFGLEDSGRKTNKGALKWKILSFPGYEPQPYSPGGAERTPRDETGAAIGAAGHDAAVLIAAMIEAGAPYDTDSAVNEYETLTRTIFHANQAFRKELAGSGTSTAADPAQPGDSGMQRSTERVTSTGAVADAPPAGQDTLATGKGAGEFCPNYSDHTFKKVAGVMQCSKCGAVRT